ncbi:MAG: glycosyltransferase, partial [Planctomycetaceae bacterium]|nr:glycosyltransferase [Planctomycetaceae bacterium]
MTTSTGTSISEGPIATAQGVADEENKTHQPIRNFLRHLYNKGPKPLRKGLLLAKAAHYFALRNGGWHRAPFLALSRCWKLIQTSGVRGMKWRLQLFLFQVSRSNSYRIPLANQLTKDQAETVHEALDHHPLISIIIPVYKVELQWLEACLNSVANQYYENWEAILVDDCSQRPELTNLMRDWTERDSRFCLVELEKNQNISAATNAGIAMASGKLIGFLDHDDELTPDALTWIAGSFHQSPNAKWFYSDEAIFAPDGQCLNLHLKPDYSPEFLLSAMYTCHFSVYAAELIHAVGGLRIGYEGAQDHDLALRLADLVDRNEVVHIPRVLYKWRAIETSTAANIATKPQAIKAGQKAVTEALARR